ncbi:MerR family transcriptional regulator [Bacillus thuringiensis]|uniref:MerR family transcriptional regulator n=1 Tax=Bacillus thuringiensis TaxID=1428 RepID=A0A9X7BSJ5_BACTU|nr:MerR family transcriptional regulator [Bacillus thuringiensis]PET23729.1 MerR family transcriptional regulator [Bacillus thuringiensis]PFL06039.1 MerR family transcriptional regulator [Bacillus thuringiensis]PFV34486.1 MerR family transcriptional regulator [Bacillus thuringiensis]PGN23313.1 MerR family transcriptional regulator [Bacillus thuringiensis]PGN26315.1 MerR family transcriptional regulator [Bacillus thuringiensis]
MSKREGCSIGEFAKRTGTSIRTLQYYDEIGLLKPGKNVSSGHRLYKGKDILELQKIVSLKVLGYSLEEIRVMLKMPSLNVNLKETLEQQRKAFEEKRRHIEVSIKALERTMVCLEEDEELDSDILMSLINSIQKENEQRLWLEGYVSKDFADGLYNKSEEEGIALDKEFVRLAKEVKRLFGRQIEDLEVQKLVDEHMKATLKYVGEETMYSLGKLENVEEQYNNMMPSPYTEEEEAWLNEAMEYYMIRNGMYSPPQ